MPKATRASTVYDSKSTPRKREQCRRCRLNEPSGRQRRQSHKKKKAFTTDGHTNDIPRHRQLNRKTYNHANGQAFRAKHDNEGTKGSLANAIFVREQRTPAKRPVSGEVPLLPTRYSARELVAVPTVERALRSTTLMRKIKRTANASDYHIEEKIMTPAVRRPARTTTPTVKRPVGTTTATVRAKVRPAPMIVTREKTPKRPSVKLKEKTFLNHDLRGCLAQLPGDASLTQGLRAQRF